MTYVFISYKSEEKRWAMSISQALEELDVECWWDTNLENSAEDFHSQIWTRLRGAAAVIVCWSPASIDSRWVRAEADWALNQGKLISARIAEVELRPPFNIVQTADLCDWNGAQDHHEWQQIVAQIRKLNLEAPTTNASGSTSGAFRPFALDQLAPVVAEAVRSAKAAEASARTAQSKALEVQAVAETAAQRATSAQTNRANKAPYYLSRAFGSGRVHAGEWHHRTKNDIWRLEFGVELLPHGYGRLQLTEGKAAGSIFWSKFNFGEAVGHAVIDYRRCEMISRLMLREEGDFSAGHIICGAKVFADGSLLLGRFSETVPNPCVKYNNDGTQFTGEVTDDELDGYGALWGANGELVLAGRWSEGNFLG